MGRVNDHCDPNGCANVPTRCQLPQRDSCAHESQRPKSEMCIRKTNFITNHLKQSYVVPGECRFFNGEFTNVVEFAISVVCWSLRST